MKYTFNFIAIMLVACFKVNLPPEDQVLKDFNARIITNEYPDSLNYEIEFQGYLSGHDTIYNSACAVKFITDDDSIMYKLNYRFNDSWKLINWSKYDIPESPEPEYQGMRILAKSTFTGRDLILTII